MWKLSGTTDEYLTNEEKGDAAAGVANTYNALLAVFDGQPVNCHEQIRYRPSSADAWERAYLRALWNPTKLFRALIQQVSGLLADSTPNVSGSSWFASAISTRRRSPIL